MARDRIDLTQPLPQLDDAWLDEEEGAWDDAVYDASQNAPRQESESESEPEQEQESRSRRSRKRIPDRARKGQTEQQTLQQEAPKRQPTGQTSALTDLLLLLFKVGLVVVFLLVLFTFFYGMTQARDTTMQPAIKEGDIVIYYRPDKDYVAGDAIVVEYNGQLQVRRVVATAGDTVDISSTGGLIINGSTQMETDIYTTTYPYTEGITFPVTVGQGEVFVLGDDRTSATDSRIYGTVATDATKGQVMLVIRRRGI